MQSTPSRTTLPSPSSTSFFTKSPKHVKPNSNLSQFKLTNENERKFTFKSLKTIQNSDYSLSFSLKSLVSCVATTETPLETTELVTDKLQLLVSEFKSLTEPIDRVKRLLRYAAILPPYNESSRVPANRVMGCTTQVWLEAKMDEFGRMRFRADSDSEITKGFCSCLIWMLDGAEPEEVLKLKSEDLAEMNVGLVGKAHSRVNTWHNVLISMQKRTKALVNEREGKVPLEPFPSLVVTAEEISAKGSYAEAQARFLFPNESKVQEIVNVLKDKKIGVVAHFYMDSEVQGVLTAAHRLWPHIYISDSLAMADTAVKMAVSGCQFVTVLGVDFMSENVRAILDQAGFRKVDVYRMSNGRIGCSLADAASNPQYLNFLKAAAMSPPSLHGFGQIPNLNVWYGPDSYVGANIAELFQHMGLMTNEEIAEIHPEDNRLHKVIIASSALLPSFEARRSSLLTPLGKPGSDVGWEPILYLRHFQSTKRLPEKLVYQILHSSGNGNLVY